MAAELQNDGAAASPRSILERQIRDVITQFHWKRDHLRRLDTTLFVSQAVFAGITTVLVGLRVDGYEAAMRNFALVASALASLMAVILGHFRFRDRYVAYTKASATLHALLSGLELIPDSGKSGTSAELRKIHSEFQAVLDEMDKRWQAILETGNRAQPKVPRQRR